MAQKLEKDFLQMAPPKTNHADKENIDPFLEKQPSTLGPNMFGMPSGKQQFGNSSAKGRTPLADITALCMLQSGLPPKQQQQSSTVLQKGLWGQQHQADKMGANSVASGGPSSTTGHRLAAMR